MIEDWALFAIIAAFFQNLRSALQKHLKGRLSDTGAAYVRFVYALPIAIIYLYWLVAFRGFPLPSVNVIFFIYCLLGGLCQILFTVCLLKLFSFHSFAVGTTFSKLEVMMVAILGAIILGDGLTMIATIAIGISTIGVVALSMGQSRLTLSTMLSGLTSRATLMGLICALWLGGSVVFFRGASLSLDHNSILVSAAFTLTISLGIQTLIMGIYLGIKTDQIPAVMKQWRWASAVGITGGLASIAWFTASTIENASYVRAVGQIELIFTFLVTVFIFKEKVSKAEGIGIILVAGGIILLLLDNA